LFQLVGEGTITKGRPTGNHDSGGLSTCMRVNYVNDLACYSPHLSRVRPRIRLTRRAVHA
jgi:hypothetical protein